MEIIQVIHRDKDSPRYRVGEFYECSVLGKNRMLLLWEIQMITTINTKGTEKSTKYYFKDGLATVEINEKNIRISV
jgi:hypothetical protein